MLREGQWQDLDYANLAEEIESVGRSDKRELGNRLTVLVMHLLKWRYQPAGRKYGHSWEDTIWEQRGQIAAILDDSPSLRREVPVRLEQQYPAARRKALRDTQLPDSVEADREVKFPIYARAGVPEAWLLDVTTERLAVYRHPTPDGYQDVRFLQRGESVAPEAFPDLALTVDILLG